VSRPTVSYLSIHPKDLTLYVVLLQGFDSGVFGGNFHTHNTLHTMPGVDMVCFSNGHDYVRGWRHAMRQAAAGRVVMVVASTALLNRRHLGPGDDAWQFPYPSSGEMGFEDVVKYGSAGTQRLGIVSYGNGMPTALQARDILVSDHGFAYDDVTVIDSPYLNHASTGLQEAVGNLDAVVFADVCKQGQNPLASIIAELQTANSLPVRWRCVAATPTYNPLGTTLTFTSDLDIVRAALEVT